MREWIISPVWKRWERWVGLRWAAPSVDGFKKGVIIVHYCVLSQPTTLAKAVYIHWQQYRCRLMVEPGSSFLWHERQWQPFCCLPLSNYGSSLPHCLLGWTGWGEGVKTGALPAGNFFTSKAAIQSIGPKPNRWHCLGRKPGFGVKTKVSQPASRMKLLTSYKYEIVKQL